MAVEITVPQMGESIVEATLSRWIKQAGDPVTAGEAIAELETDKVNMDVTAEHSGVLSDLRFQEGDTVRINDVIALLNESNGAAAPASEASAAEPAGKPAEKPAEKTAEKSASENGQNRATPLAAKIAQENKVDLATVQGSGSGGKIIQQDVKAAIEGKREEGRGKSGDAAPQKPEVKTQNSELRTQNSEQKSLPSSLFPLPSEARRETRLRMSRRRQTIAERLKEAQNTAAMLTTFNEVDMTAVMEIRKRRRDSFKERHGVGLGFMSFFAKACIGALKAFPYLNAEIQGNEIVLKHYYDIGIAVGAEEGLVVPVVRDADRKTFAEIEREIGDLAARARENKLSLPELMGGTFTLTNGGIFGSLMSTPILNYPQVGILGMHKIQERAMVVNGEIAVRPMMYLALSYDHRIVDGSDAVRFLVRIKDLLEDPENLLLEG